MLQTTQIYGAIAFYLHHQAGIDEYLIDTRQEFEGNDLPLEQGNPTLGPSLVLAGIRMPPKS